MLLLQRLFPRVACLLILLISYSACEDDDRISFTSDGDDAESASETEMETDGDLDNERMEEVDSSPDGDIETETEEQSLPCEGPCSTDAFEAYCSDSRHLCVCGENGQMSSRECKDHRSRMPNGCNTHCLSREGVGADCVCTNGLCFNDLDCRIMDKGDYCVSFLMNNYCAAECPVVTCDDGSPCIDVARPGGRGVCFPQGIKPDEECQAVGLPCTDGKLCSTVCLGLVTDGALFCLEPCQALSNSCAEDEICMGYDQDRDGRVDHGVCSQPFTSYPDCGWPSEDGDEN